MSTKKGKTVADSDLQPAQRKIIASKLEEDARYFRSVASEWKSQLGKDPTAQTRIDSLNRQASEAEAKAADLRKDT